MLTVNDFNLPPTDFIHPPHCIFTAHPRQGCLFPPPTAYWNNSPPPLHGHKHTYHPGYTRAPWSIRLVLGYYYYYLLLSTAIC